MASQTPPHDSQSPLTLIKPEARVEIDRPLSPYMLTMCFNISKGGLSLHSRLQNFQIKTPASSLEPLRPIELDEYQLPTNLEHELPLRI